MELQVAELALDYEDPGLQPWSVRPEPAPVAAPAAQNGDDLTRNDLRRLILEELRELVGS